MRVIDFLFGSPLPTTDERAERIGPMAGIPIFGLDALSSAAYGPEAALTILMPLGAAGVRGTWCAIPFIAAVPRDPGRHHLGQLAWGPRNRRHIPLAHLPVCGNPPDRNCHRLSADLDDRASGASGGSTPASTG